MATVLLLSLGPVQDFIAAARRGRDLWFGSWLLSELGRAAALAAARSSDAGVDALVMPAPSSIEALESDDTSFTNKLLVRVPGNGKQAAAVAREMEQAVRDRLSEIAAISFDAIRGRFARATAEQQVDDLVEVHWATVEEGPELGYAAARRLAEAALAAQKATRSFVQPSWGSSDRKSSLDGLRESVLPADAYPSRQDRGQRRRNRIRRLYDDYRVGAAERLCGVGLVKRWGAAAASREADGSRVVSTPHLASWSTRRFFTGPDARPQHEAWRAAFGTYRATLVSLGADLSETPRRDPVLGRTDGAVLFGSRLGEVLPPDCTDSDLREAEKALSQLFSAWRKIATQAGVSPPPRPAPYFSVMLADGDRMGKALDALKSPDDHRRVTRSLEQFAARARTIVDSHHGHLVYAGGDDVLALLPTATALACAEALRLAFAETAGHALVALGQPSPPTLSVGVQVAHQGVPFARALAGAREAEAHAKHGVGRDAWAVQVDKRGGAPVLVGRHWADLGQLTDLLDQFLADGAGLPRGLPYALRDLAETLDTRRPEAKPSVQVAAALPVIRRLEAERVLTQKQVAVGPRSLLLRQLDATDADLHGLSARLIVARSLAALTGDSA